MNLKDPLNEIRGRRARDAKRFEQLDGDTCQLCDARGADKRSLFLSCFYAIQEVLPEAIDMRWIDGYEERGYFLRICKSCRARLLGHLRQWREECVALRELPKDHDGYADEEYVLVIHDPRATIPVRVDGAVIYMTPEQHEQYRRKL